MVKKINRNEARLKRHYRLRNNISGTATTPRMNVFRSNKAIYVQFIDDVNGVTLASASSVDLKETTNNIEVCQKVGKLAAENVQKVGIEAVVFDRGGYKYHGKIKAVADAAREAGLKF